MPTNSDKQQAVDDFIIPAQHAWRMEAFENTFTYSDYESYLIVHLDEWICSFLTFKLGNITKGSSRRVRIVSELKTIALAFDHQRWWHNQKLRAIKEARRLQEEQEA